MRGELADIVHANVQQERATHSSTLPDDFLAEVDGTVAVSAG